MITLQLPHQRDLGRIARWFLPLPQNNSVRPSDDRAARNGADVNIEQLLDEMEYYPTIARFIGYSSSHTRDHWEHPTGEYVQRGARCNACRWFELRIFREIDRDVDSIRGVPETELKTIYDENRDDDQLGDFIVYKAGMSIVPGEVPYCRYDSITSPYEVVEALTTRRTTPTGQQVFITRPSALALAGAAQFDDNLKEAYVDRAVT